MLMNKFRRRLIYLIEMVLYNFELFVQMNRYNLVVVDKDQREY